MKLHSVLSALVAVSFAHAAPTDAAFESAFRVSLLKSFEEASGKILRLAEAIPEGTYDWRPMEGVSSVREVLVHVAATNYALAERLGTKPPAGIDRRRMEDSMQTKVDAISATRSSIAWMNRALAAVPARELLPEVNVFGNKLPKVRVALLPVDHAHEHLGQLIAYARMNRIVPPWSQ